MDATEDKDIKLQKASVGLFDNFNDLLPKLLWSSKADASNTFPSQEERILRRTTSNKELWTLLGLVSHHSYI